MKIELDEKEYRSLLEIMEIADWVLHAHSVDDPPETQKYRQVAQKIYAAAKDTKSQNLVHYDPEARRFYPSEQLEENEDVLDRIAAFENACFWDELIERLVERDLLETMGGAAFAQMDPAEQMKRGEPIEKRYETLFQESGIDRLVVAEEDLRPSGRKNTESNGL